MDQNCGARSQPILVRSASNVSAVGPPNGSRRRAIRARGPRLNRSRRAIVRARHRCDECTRTLPAHTRALVRCRLASARRAARRDRCTDARVSRTSVADAPRTRTRHGERDRLRASWAQWLIEDDASLDGFRAECGRERSPRTISELSSFSSVSARSMRAFHSDRSLDAMMFLQSLFENTSHACQRRRRRSNFSSDACDVKRRLITSERAAKRMHAPRNPWANP